jgi:hypothetical protein
MEPLEEAEARHPLDVAGRRSRGEAIDGDAPSIRDSMVSAKCFFVPVSFVFDSFGRAFDVVALCKLVLV